MSAATSSSGAEFAGNLFDAIADAARSYKEPATTTQSAFTLQGLGPIGWICVGFTNSLSVLACAWLLCRYRLLSERTSKILPVRQLWHLAVADICYSVFDIGYNLIQAINHTYPISSSDSMCQGTMFVMLVGMYTSAFIETSLAFGFAFDYWRCKSCVRVLDASLLWLWPLATIVAFIDMVSNLQSGEDQCVVERMAVRKNEALIVLTCFIVSLGAYVASLLRVHMFPGSVQGLIWRMALVYPVNFFLTYIYPSLESMHTWLVIIAYSLLGLNGFVNAASYAANCRYVKRTMSLRSHGSYDSNRSPRLNECTEVRHWDFVDFHHVGFREHVESVIEVTPNRTTRPQRGFGSSFESKDAKIREQMQTILSEMQSQDVHIMSITSRMVERGLTESGQLPGVPVFDRFERQRSMCYSDVQQLEKVRERRDSWIRHHEARLSLLSVS
eukprot:TRINITY_DN34399_c0_g1_i4.p1 TRINITY_DN34399_c0_g1~~TRINITY_DN34399_c0_g1_i4.p1  ORF type:complete len:443 (-),score=54.69 TRINITY_DN34399_c0_g1_i4:296-1624(-)